MKKSAFWFIAATVVIIGTLGGLHLRRSLNRWRDQSLKNTEPLRILTYRHVLSRELLSEFENRSSVRVDVKEVADPEELWNLIEVAPSSPGQRFDLVSMFSYQIPLANQLVRLQPVQRQLLKNRAAISPDFQNIPGEVNLESMVPVLWGLTGLAYSEKSGIRPESMDSWENLLSSNINKQNLLLLPSTIEILRLALQFSAPTAKGGETEPTLSQLKAALSPLLNKSSFGSDFLTLQNQIKNRTAPANVMMINHGEMGFPPFDDNPDWKFVLPQERATLWILAFGLTRETQLTKEAHEFLDFLLEKKWAEEMVLSSHQASTQITLERNELDPVLKPSYLREIPLSKYVLWADFSRSRELRNLIVGSSAAE